MSEHASVPNDPAPPGDLLYVDARLAEFEASLQKTSSQVGLMREQLAKRSKLDDSDVVALPSI